MPGRLRAPFAFEVPENAFHEGPGPAEALKIRWPVGTGVF
jgi:hypothetical protein